MKKLNVVRYEISCDSISRGSYKGRGVGVAILDTGIYLHEDLAGRVACFRDFTGVEKYSKNIYETCYDDNGHGTHIAGMIAGSGTCSNGKYEGIAPEAHLIICKVLDKNGNGKTKDVLRALRFCIENRERYRIRIINISIGSNPGRKDASDSMMDFDERVSLIQGVEEAWNAGIVVVTAAGNNGPAPMSVTTPGISRKVITVGAMDDASWRLQPGRKCGSYSGRGPTPYCIMKPEIVAPGANVTSCANRQGAYCIKSGTSMATAVVSGCIALLLEKYPGAGNAEVKLRLAQRAVDLHLPKNQQGWGGIDLRTLL